MQKKVEETNNKNETVKNKNSGSGIGELKEKDSKPSFFSRMKDKVFPFQILLIPRTHDTDEESEAEADNRNVASKQEKRK